MFGDFFARLTAPASNTPLADSDARLALGALLVRLARADGQYDRDEAAQIDAVLMSRYGLGETAAAELRARCENAETEAPDTVRFTKAIKDAVRYEDREAVIGALWSVVLADGVRDKNEDALLRMVAPMLGVSDQVSHQIRQRIMRQQS